MTVQELADLLRIIFPTAEIKTGVQFPEIIIPAESLVETAHRLRNHEALSLDYLVSATAVDYADNLMLVYHIDSTRFRYMVVLKTFTSGRDNPYVDSVADQWPGAGFHECEIYDLFGIRFHNHPGLRRMFMEEDYGFPLRKDFRDETRVLTL